MSGDFSGYLQRYQGRAVSVVTWDHVRMMGTLSEVMHDSILMTGVLVQDSHEADSWSTHLVAEDVLENRGNLWPEIVIQRNLISTVTLIDPRGVSTLKIQTNIGDLVSSSKSQSASQSLKDDYFDEKHFAIAGDAVVIELGLGLVSLVVRAEGNLKPLNVRLQCLRMEMEKKLGFEIQPFRVTSCGIDVPPEGFRLIVHGTEVFRSEIHAGKWLAICPEAGTDFKGGIRTKEPAFGLDARWIDAKDQKAAEVAGCTVVDASSVIVTAVSEHLNPHSASLLTYEAVNTAVENLRASHPATVSELIPSPVSTRTLFEVLRHLVDQGVSIQHIRPIIESAARHVEHASSMERLVANVRKDIGVILVRGLLTSDNQVPVITVSQRYAESVFKKFDANRPAQSSLLDLQERVQLFLGSSNLSKAALVVPGGHRALFAAICQTMLPEVTVLATDECMPRMKTQVLGSIDLVENGTDPELMPAEYNEDSEERSTAARKATARRKPR